MSEDRKRPELSRQRSVKFSLAPGSQGPSMESSSSVASDEDLDYSRANNSFSSRFRVTKVQAAAAAAERRESGCSVGGGGRRGSLVEDEGCPPYGARRPSTFDMYETQKTFGRNTLESLPHIDHYRNLFAAGGRLRPTLMELHEQVV